jgi:poly [ADP-ribose] polymerase
MQNRQVLNEVLETLQQKPLNKGRLTDCTNRFYTLIPHDFGEHKPPLIDDEEAVRKKMSLIETLFDIEIAASLMK